MKRKWKSIKRGKRVVWKSTNLTHKTTFFDKNKKIGVFLFSNKSHSIIWNVSCNFMTSNVCNFADKTIENCFLETNENQNCIIKKLNKHDGLWYRVESLMKVFFSDIYSKPRVKRLMWFMRMHLLWVFKCSQFFYAILWRAKSLLLGVFWLFTMQSAHRRRKCMCISITSKRDAVILDQIWDTYPQRSENTV